MSTSEGSFNGVRGIEANAERKVIVLDVKMAKVSDGLGYGDGSISYVERAGKEVSAGTLDVVEALIASPEILIAVDTDKNGHLVTDDGCGDGRGVGRVFRGNEEKSRSLNRSKVFGGGAAQAAAILIGLGRTEGIGLVDTFSAGIDKLVESHIDFGAHTDDHATGPNCGCGAIDKAPAVLLHAVNLKDDIRGSIQALGIDTDGLDEVFDAYEDYSVQINGRPYEGRQVLEQAINRGKIVKELQGEHREMYVVLNTVEGMTVNQQKVREISDDTVQVFATDVWRMQQLAEQMYAGEPQETKHKAFLSELVYTLAVAATLTKGDLPVYVIQAQPGA